MKKILLFLVMGLFLVSFVAAEINLEGQVNEIYNLGDIINTKIKITADYELNDVLKVNLVCLQGKTESYKEFIFLPAGEIKEREILIPLIKDFINLSKGNCYLESDFGGAIKVLTESFLISDLIELKLIDYVGEVDPGKTFVLTGEATKQNGLPVNGIVEAKLIIEDSMDLESLGTVVEGVFSLELNIPEELKAGKHAFNLKVYEKDSKQEITNVGILNENLKVNQKVSNLEIFIEDNEILPGENLKAKIILHDQTGEKIISNAFVAVKNLDGEFLSKLEVQTDESFEFAVPERMPAQLLKISVYSEGFEREEEFSVGEKKALDFEFVNDTLIVTNVGNVIYEDVVEVKIGENYVPIDVNLKVGDSSKYVISAPEGEYNIEVEGVNNLAMLTGKAIDVKKVGGLEFSFSIVWIFVLVVLAVFAYFVFRKGSKKNFFERVKKYRNRTPSKLSKKEKRVIQERGILNSINPLYLSLSIHGNRQDSTIACMRIKNYAEIRSGEGNVNETLNKIKVLVENGKGMVYENKENIYFVFAPEKTRTFKNELHVINLTEKIKKTIDDHNKLFKLRIEYGLSVNYGSILLKQGKIENHFMAMDNVLTNAKKLSGLFDERVIFDEKIKVRLGAEARTERHEKMGNVFYCLKGIVGKVDHSRFLKGFMERLDKK